MTAAHEIQLFAIGVNGPVRWRMLSGNNREVGRGTAAYPDEQACQDAVAAGQHEVGGWTGKLRRTEQYRWRWELQHDGVIVAVAGHTYDRQVRCEMALTQFRARFPSAPVRTGVVFSGARRWGSMAV